MMDMLDLNVGFWTGVLLIVAIILAVWGAVYAAVLIDLLVWVALIAVLALLVWTGGARAKRLLVQGRRKK